MLSGGMVSPALQTPTSLQADGDFQESRLISLLSLAVCLLTVATEASTEMACYGY
jgi:hypothetical protein